MRSAALLLFAAAASLLAQDGSTQQNWPHYGGLESAWRHSALTEVNRANVKKLVPAWAFQTGMSDSGLQSTPIVVDGVMPVASITRRALSAPKDPAVPTATIFSP